MDDREQLDIAKDRNKKKHKKARKIIATAITFVIVGATLPYPAKADDLNEDMIAVTLRDLEEKNTQEEDSVDLQNFIKEEAFIHIADRIQLSEFKALNQINTENQAFIINMSQGEVLAGANFDQKVAANDILRPMVIQVILGNHNLDEVVTITEKMIQATSPNSNVFGLRKGDKLTLGDLLSIYLLSEDEDVYHALVLHASKNNFLSMLNQTASMLTMTQTKFTNITGAYHKNQGSSVYDAYSLYRNLMKNSWFMETVKEKEIEITYKDSKNKKIKKTVENLNASWSVTVNIGGGYQYYGQISMRGDQGRDGQFVIFTDEDQNFYLSYLGNVNSLRNIGSESGRLIRTLLGYTFIDSEILATPTPIPTPTSTPIPTAKPTPTSTPTATPTPTMAPTPTPAASKSGLPTSSNDARYQYIMGTNYIAYTMNNRPAGYRSDAEAKLNMTTIVVPVWKMTSNGGRIPSTMNITIHKKLAKSVAEIFKEIYALDIKFPIKTLVGYGYRKVGGVGLVNSSLMSAHSFGSAIDINPGDYDNDYYLGKGNDLRDKTNPYCIPDEVIEIFRSHGWLWGGDFEICSDTMHFQYLGLEFLSYQGKNYFRELSHVEGDVMNGKDVKNLQQRLSKLGYKVNTSGKYYKTSANAVKIFQKDMGLPVTGVVDYKTWETLINLTHYMSYVF